MSNPLLWGFKLVKFQELTNLKVLDITDDIPFSTQENCPGDRKKLQTICTIIGNNGKQKIRVGGCTSCGYIGYIDRPTREWINEYYLENWDSAKEREFEQEVEKRKKAGISDKEGEVITLVRSINPDKSRAVLEIGCGYGQTLKRMEKFGFSKLLGVENSTFRARVAQEVYNFEVFAKAFEDSDLQKILTESAPFSLIFSYHVFEHVYDPEEIIRLSANLQKEGDYMIIGTPNALGEFSMSPLLYLPHLHSYTRETFAKILSRHGYEIINDSLTDFRRLNLLARKVKSISTKEENAVIPVDYLLRKFAYGTGIGRKYASISRRLWWFRKNDIGGQTEREQNSLIHIFTKKFLQKAFAIPDPICSAEIEGLEKRFTTYDESPIEIQFEENIKLLCK